MYGSPFKGREPKHKVAMYIFELAVSSIAFIVLLLGRLGIIAISDGTQILDVGLFCFFFIIASLIISIQKELSKKKTNTKKK